ncbi:MAG: four helix bundle protein [Candidatus Didemnitutus sp.]|nr:four helix bundle protein [Candidatus Didemnitutus sp.]
MTREEFKARTKAFALRAVSVAESLPSDPISQVFVRQLVRCSTSVAANYRAAVRGKSRADFIAKMAIVEEECDETLFWLETLIDTKRLPAARSADLQREGDEILSIVVASIKTARRGR